MSRNLNGQIYFQTTHLQQLEKWWNGQVMKSDIKGKPLPDLKELKHFRKK